MEILNIIFFKLFLIIQFLACIAAIYYWKYYKNSFLWVFLPLMLYTFLNEVLIQILMANGIRLNRLLYNLYTVTTFLIYLYWFDKILKLKIWKWALLIVFLIAIGYDLMLHGINGQLLKTGLLVQSIMLILLSVLYYIGLLKDDKVVNYQKIPEFWFILGLLTFYIALTPLQLATGIGLNIKDVYNISIQILNLILYGCYIIGFYLTSRK